MTSGGSDHLAGLPDNVRRLLSEPPFTGKKLLELRMQWPQLSPQHARFADALRLFVITWDPLEHKASRPHGFATVNIHPLELVVYVPIWSLLKLAAERDRGVATVLNTMGGAAVVTAAAHEENVMAGRYPRSAVDGAVPDLLSDVAGGSALGPAQIRLVSPGWEDIGLGAITDVVQHAFGPVDLDRSPVELAARRPLQPGCPACAGRRFGFPPTWLILGTVCAQSTSVRRSRSSTVGSPGRTPVTPTGGRHSPTPQHASSSHTSPTGWRPSSPVRTRRCTSALSRLSWRSAPSS